MIYSDKKITWVIFLFVETASHHLLASKPLLLLAAPSHLAVGPDYGAYSQKVQGGCEC